MSAESNNWGEIKGYKGIKVPDGTNKDIILTGLMHEYVPKWYYLFYFVSFLIVSIVFAYITTNEAGKIEFRFAEFISFRGSLAGGALFGAIFTVLCSKGKLQISSK